MKIAPIISVIFFHMMKNPARDVFNVRRRNNGRNQQTRQDVGSNAFGQHHSILPYAHSHNTNTSEEFSYFKRRSFSSPNNETVERKKKLLSIIGTMMIIVICLGLYFKRGTRSKEDVGVEVDRLKIILDGETENGINSMMKNDIRNEKRSFYDYKKYQEDNFGLALEKIEIEENSIKKELGDVPPFQAAQIITNTIIANVSYVNREWNSFGNLHYSSFCFLQFMFEIFLGCFSYTDRSMTR